METTFKQIAIEKISKKNAKSIFSILSYTSFDGDSNNVGYEICKMIVENSNDFTKSIAEQWITLYENDNLDMIGKDGQETIYKLSDKQTWCLAYQVMNNINVYIS